MTTAGFEINDIINPSIDLILWMSVSFVRVMVDMVNEYQER